MKRTVSEKIVGLKRMIRNYENPKLIMEEVESILNQIESIENQIEKSKAMLAMLEIAVDLIEKVDGVEDIKPSGKIGDILDMLSDRKSKVKELHIKVKEYNNSTIIEIDKKITYSKLIEVLNNVRKDFDETTNKLFSASYHRKKKKLILDYIHSDIKNIVIDMSSWNMSTDVAKVYVEGLAEYISK